MYLARDSTESLDAEKEQDQHSERLRIVRAAAAITREDIRSAVNETASYPASQNIMQDVQEVIPETLNALLTGVIMQNRKGNIPDLEVKCNAIAHAIISATRPRSFLSPIHIEVAVYLHRKFGSKLMIQILSNLGFCATYDEAILYESSALMKHEINLSDGAFAQYVFDNADHNVNTIDGHNTFHSMGGIICVTSGSGVKKEERIERLKQIPTAKQVAAIGKIPIKLYQEIGKSGLKDIGIDNVSEVQILPQELPIVSLQDFLWMLGKWRVNQQIPSWGGFMECLTQDMEYEKSSVVCLPFVNLPPSNKDTINTVIHFAVEQSHKIGFRTCFVTFDQPLYIKAREIVATAGDSSNIRNVIVRLGGFHMLMSYLGAVGYIMEGSGLKELWTTTYAQGSIDKMLTGHAFARSLRAHLLTQLALAKLLINECDINSYELDKIDTLLENFKQNPPTFTEVDEKTDISNILEKFKIVIQNVETRGNTAQLWLQYFNLISLAKQFIQAERMGDWKLHLDCVQRMLPVFHASGHLAYAKSGQLYLQDMLKVKANMPSDEFKAFVEKGFFTVRRSEKLWSGIWTDMTIEQTLMRSMKSSGGLTHGRGISSSVLARWILGMPATHAICEEIENFSGVRSSTLEQHVDLRSSSMQRDEADSQRLYQWLSSHQPLSIPRSNLSPRELLAEIP